MHQKIRRVARNIILPTTASLLFSSAAYADDLLRSATFLEFKDNSVMTEKSSGLGMQLPFLVSKRLENNFRIINRPDVTKALLENPVLDKDNLDRLSKNFPDLDYIIFGDYSIISNRDLSISSVVVDIKTGKIATQYFEGKLEDLFGAVDTISDEIKTDLGYQSTKTEQKKEPVYPVKPEKQEEPKIGLLARKGKWTLSPLAGFTFPLAPDGFKDLYKHSFNVAVEIAKIGGRNFGFGFPIIDYNVHEVNTDKIATRIGTGSFDVLELGSVSFLDIGGLVNLYPILNSDTVPSFSIGGGYTHGKDRGAAVTINRRRQIIAEETTDNGGNIFVKFNLEQLVGKSVSLKGSAAYKHLFLGDGFDTFSLNFGLGFYFGGDKK